MDLQILIAPLAGSVIGYSTNWLAIKMLFKPHKEYRIGPMKVPFTPGLIPRERDRIAKSLGQAVGGNLLTEEVIIKELVNETIVNNLKAYVASEIIGKSFTIDGFLDSFIKDKDELYQLMAGSIAKSIKEYIKDGQTIESKVAKALDHRVDRSKALSGLLGDDVYSSLEGLVRSNEVGIANGICLSLADPEIAEKIKGIIGRLVSEKLGGLAAMFVDPNGLYESILDFVRSYLEEEENRHALSDQILRAGRSFADKPVSDYISLEQSEKWLNAISIKTVDEMGKLTETEEFIEVITDMMTRLAQKEVLVAKKFETAMESGVEKFYLNFVNTRIPIFLEQLNLANVVESEINNFTTSQVEDLIFGIVDRELKAITWLGALLGALMGGLSLIF